jgi:proline dehydrogenase
MIAVACSPAIRRTGEAFGRRTGLAGQFVSGQTIADHLANVDRLAGVGIRASSFHLGEYVTDPAQVEETVELLEQVIDGLAAAGRDVHVSVDPSQLGYMQDRDWMITNAERLARRIAAVEAVKSSNGMLQSPADGPWRRRRLMIDMEDFAMVDDTLALHDHLRDRGYPVAQTLQACLFRTKDDLEARIAQGAMVRLVKGAMAPGARVAFTQRADIDENYLKLANRMLSPEAQHTGFVPVFGTHDPALAGEIAKIAQSQDWHRGEYEFEMLYGVNMPLQRRLREDGHVVRLYAPFGRDWWAYAWRRVGENPRNLGLLLRASLHRSAA